MKIHHLFAMLLALTLSSCQAQANLISISNTQKGNTGHRGIIPDDENYKPIKGKEYYSLTLTIKGNCTLEIIDLTVKADGGQVKLKPKFEDGSIKKRFKKGETVYLHVEKENEMTVAKPNIEGEGNLSLKINGRLKQMPIKAFTMIFPM